MVLGLRVCSHDFKARDSGLRLFYCWPSAPLCGFKGKESAPAALRIVLRNTHHLEKQPKSGDQKARFVGGMAGEN